MYINALETIKVFFKMCFKLEEIVKRIGSLEGGGGGAGENETLFCPRGRGS